MKAETISKKVDQAQIIKELNALLLTIPASRKTARLFIEKAIAYVEKY